MSERLAYIRDGAAIYERSFAIIRAEADLARFSPEEERVAVRIIHATGMAGAVVAIGNAPTALFRLLEMLDAGAPKPAAIIGMPVGFVGAAESKEALIADGRVPFITIRGRKGGSAMTAAAINALASGRE